MRNVKNVKKHRVLKVSLFLIAFGVVLVGLGFSFGAKKTISWRSGRPKVSQVVKFQKALPSSVQNLDIATSDLQVEVKPGSRFEVQSSISDVTPEVRVENGTAVIRAHQQTNNFGMTLDFNQPILPHLTVTVPEDQTLDTVKMGSAEDNSSWGVFSVRDISANQFDFENTSADELDLSHVTARKSLKVNSKDSYGYLSLEQVKTVDFNADISGGTVELNDLTVTGKSSVNLQAATLKLSGVHQFAVVSVLKSDGTNGDMASTLHVDGVKQALPYLKVQQAKAEASARQTQLQALKDHVQALVAQEAAIDSDKSLTKAAKQAKQEALKEQTSDLQEQMQTLTAQIQNSLKITSHDSEVHLNQ